MSEHRGISAAEKYAELEKAGASRPRCSCHGEEMGWRGSDRRGGGQWKCVKKGRESCRRWHEANHESVRERKRRHREANLEKFREQARRFYNANQDFLRAKARDYWRLNK